MCHLFAIIPLSLFIEHHFRGSRVWRIDSEYAQEIYTPCIVVLSDVRRITKRSRRSHSSSPEPEPVCRSSLSTKSSRNGPSPTSLYRIPCSSFGLLRLRDILGLALQPRRKARKGRSGDTWTSWTRRTRGQTTQAERREQEW